MHTFHSCTHIHHRMHAGIHITTKHGCRCTHMHYQTHACIHASTHTHTLTCLHTIAVQNALLHVGKIIQIYLIEIIGIKPSFVWDLFPVFPDGMFGFARALIIWDRLEVGWSKRGEWGFSFNKWAFLVILFNSQKHNFPPTYNIVSATCGVFAIDWDSVTLCKRNRATSTGLYTMGPYSTL